MSLTSHTAGWQQKGQHGSKTHLADGVSHRGAHSVLFYKLICMRYLRLTMCSLEAHMPNLENAFCRNIAWKMTELLNLDTVNHSFSMYVVKHSTIFFLLFILNYELNCMLYLANWISKHLLLTLISYSNTYLHKNIDIYIHASLYIWTKLTHLFLSVKWLHQCSVPRYLQ